MILYNTLTGTKQPLTTQHKGKVSLYTCGLTVYSQPHIGNWLGYIYWDVLVRTLEHDGLMVERTQNITDVGHLVSDDDSGEDKMEKGARASGMTAWQVAEKYIGIADTEAHDVLQLKRPTHLIRATDCIPEQISFVSILEEKGFTYIIEHEGVYFDTSKLSDYGKLARLDVQGLQAGARVEVGGKRNKTDFALWKFTPSGVNRDMEWDSPWGRGFPGWHLECSAIARQSLGDTLDIHTGGIDHIPVHHTNEIAQSESLTGEPLATQWLHNNHLKINGTKISKSLGNLVTLSDITSRGFDIEAFKLVAYSKHYRTEGNFDWMIMLASQQRLNRWKNTAALRHQLVGTAPKTDNSFFDTFTDSLIAALNDDLDTPAALRSIDEAMRYIETNGLTSSEVEAFSTFITLIHTLLGIDLLSLSPDITHAQQQVLLERAEARNSKDFAQSDLLRQKLETDGITVRDTANRQIWEYATGAYSIDEPKTS